MALAFLDTNVFLRHLRQDDPIQSPKATAFFAKIEAEEIRVRTSDTVVFETVFTLQKVYREPRNRIVSGVLPLLKLQGIILPGKTSYRRVFDLFAGSKLGFADCYHVVLMQRLHIPVIVSFDGDFDHIVSIKRLEPS